MTRWKREPRATLRLMHAHHLYSRWHDHVLNAAVALGLCIGVDSYPNCSGDGSWDREWYTLADALDRVGGLSAVHALAHEYADREYTERTADNRSERQS